MNIESILESEVVDLTSLKTFFASDLDSLKEIIEVFITDSEPKIADLEKNLETVNYTETKSIAHFFKSSFGLMGIKCVNEITELETNAENKVDEQVILDQLNFIVPICKNSISEYKEILSKLEAL